MIKQKSKTEAENANESHYIKKCEKFPSSEITLKYRLLYDIKK